MFGGFRSNLRRGYEPDFLNWVPRIPAVDPYDWVYFFNNFLQRARGRAGGLDWLGGFKELMVECSTQKETSKEGLLGLVHYAGVEEIGSPLHTAYLGWQRSEAPTAVLDTYLRFNLTPQQVPGLTDFSMAQGEYVYSNYLGSYMEAGLGASGGRSALADRSSNGFRQSMFLNSPALTYGRIDNWGFRFGYRTDGNAAVIWSEDIKANLQSVIIKTTLTQAQLGTVTMSAGASTIVFTAGDPVALGMLIGQTIKVTDIGGPNDGALFKITAFGGTSNRTLTVTPAPGGLASDATFTVTVYNTLQTAKFTLLSAEPTGPGNSPNGQSFWWIGDGTGMTDQKIVQMRSDMIQLLTDFGVYDTIAVPASTPGANCFGPDAILGVTPSALTITEAQITSIAADFDSSTLIAGTGDPVLLGLQRGDWIKLAGVTAANNNKYFRITDFPTPRDIVVTPRPTTMAADTNFTLTRNTMRVMNRARFPATNQIPATGYSGYPVTDTISSNFTSSNLPSSGLTNPITTVNGSDEVFFADPKFEVWGKFWGATLIGFTGGNNIPAEQINGRRYITGVERTAGPVLTQATLLNVIANPALKMFQFGGDPITGGLQIGDEFTLTGVTGSNNGVTFFVTGFSGVATPEATPYLRVYTDPVPDVMPLQNVFTVTIQRVTGRYKIKMGAVANASGAIGGTAGEITYAFARPLTAPANAAATAKFVPPRGGRLQNFVPIYRSVGQDVIDSGAKPNTKGSATTPVIRRTDNIQGVFLHTSWRKAVYAFLVFCAHDAGYRPRNEPRDPRGQGYLDIAEEGGFVAADVQLWHYWHAFADTEFDTVSGVQKGAIDKVIINPITYNHVHWGADHYAQWWDCEQQDNTDPDLNEFRYVRWDEIVGAAGIKWSNWGHVMDDQRAKGNGFTKSNIVNILRLPNNDGFMLPCTHNTSAGGRTILQEADDQYRWCSGVDGSTPPPVGSIIIRGTFGAGKYYITDTGPLGQQQCPIGLVLTQTDFGATVDPPFDVHLTAVAATSRLVLDNGDPVAKGMAVGDTLTLKDVAGANDERVFTVTGFAGTSNREILVTPAPADMTADTTFTFHVQVPLLSGVGAGGPKTNWCAELASWMAANNIVKFASNASGVTFGGTKNRYCNQQWMDFLPNLTAGIAVVPDQPGPIVDAYKTVVVGLGGTVSDDRYDLLVKHIGILFTDYPTLWPKIRYLGIIAGENTQQAIVDIRQRLIGTLGAATAAPTFTASRGFAFDGVNDDFQTGFIPATHGTIAGLTSMTFDQCMIGMYSRVDRAGVTGQQAQMGCSHSVGGTAGLMRMVVKSTTNAIGATLYSQAANIAAGQITNSIGLSCIQRQGSTMTAWKRGVQVGSTAVTSSGAALAGFSLRLGCVGNSVGGIVGSSYALTDPAMVVSSLPLTTDEHMQLKVWNEGLMREIGAWVDPPSE